MKILVPCHYPGILKSSFATVTQSGPPEMAGATETLPHPALQPGRNLG